MNLAPTYIVLYCIVYNFFKWPKYKPQGPLDINIHASDTYTKASSTNNRPNRHGITTTTTVLLLVSYLIVLTLPIKSVDVTVMY